MLDLSTKIITVEMTTTGYRRGIKLIRIAVCKRWRSVLDPEIKTQKFRLPDQDVKHLYNHFSKSVNNI